MSENNRVQPADQNQWYVLMTVAAVPDDKSGHNLSYYDKIRNRQLWNRWASSAVPDYMKDHLIRNHDIEQDDLVGLTNEDYDEVYAALNKRLGEGFDIPDPNKAIAFKGIRFSQFFSCRGLVFPSLTFFMGVTFEGVADFQGAFFLENLHFYAVFREDAKFYDVKFFRLANFDRSKFCDAAYFGNASFGSFTWFRDVKFLSETDFKEAIFKRFPPEFFGAKFHENTRWSLDETKWPLPERGRLSSDIFIRSYERLKLHMDEKRRFPSEHFFLRCELRSREIEYGDSFEGYMSRAYRAIANYGWSVKRPIACLIGLWIFGAALIGISEFWDHCLGYTERSCLNDAAEEFPEKHLSIFQSVALSFSNMFPFLGLGNTFLEEELRSLTSLSELISSIQTILGPVLLFFLILSLRNRFRIK